MIIGKQWFCIRKASKRDWTAEYTFAIFGLPLKHVMDFHMGPYADYAAACAKRDFMNALTA